MRLSRRWIFLARGFGGTYTYSRAQADRRMAAQATARMWLVLRKLQLQFTNISTQFYFFVINKLLHLLHLIEYEQ